MLSRLFAPKVKVSAHCDLPCGVYNPAQARIEAESVKAVQEKIGRERQPALPGSRHGHQGAARQLHSTTCRCSGATTQAPALREVPGAAPLVNDTLKALSAAKPSTDPATGQEGAGLHRPDRQDLLGDQEA